MLLYSHLLVISGKFMSFYLHHILVLQIGTIFEGWTKMFLVITLKITFKFNNIQTFELWSAGNFSFVKYCKLFKKCVMIKAICDSSLDTLFVKWHHCKEVCAASFSEGKVRFWVSSRGLGKLWDILSLHTMHL